MAFTTITLEKHDRVGTLTLNRPEKLNAMTPALIAEFADALTEVERDPEIKVLVIRGAGRAFSTGYDLTGGWLREALHDRRRSKVPATLSRTLAAIARFAQAGDCDGARLLPRRRDAVVRLHGYDFRRR